LNLAGDYNLWSEAKISGRYTLFTNPDGWSGNGAIGLKQGIKFSPGLRGDVAYEHVFGDVVGQTPAGNQFFQPFAPGQSGASLGLQGGDSYSVGLEYNDSPSLQAMARYEHRSSGSGSNTVISANAKGKLSPELTALVRYQRANSANQTIQGLGTTVDLKAGLAYRNPKNDRFNGLFRYEYRKNPSLLPSSILFSNGTGSSEHLFALEGIYSPNWQWEFYGKAALRTGKSYLSEDLISTNTIGLVQARAVYRFHQNWDITGEARWIGQGSAAYSEWGAVVEAGYYLNPNLRLYAGYTFGGVSDRDFDGSRKANGAYLGVAVKLNELFNGFGLQKTTPQKPGSDQVVKAVSAKAIPLNPP
jgi:predicted porin